VETNRLDFSVIFSVEHRGHFLRNALLSAQQLDWPPDSFEILAVAQGGDKKTEEEVQKIAGGKPIIRYFASSSPTFAGRLNSACAAAQGRILAFADDDCELAPDWLRNIAEAFEALPNAGLIGGIDELRPTADAFSVALDCVLGSFVGTAGCRSTNGLKLGRCYPKLQNMAIKREAAERVAEERGRDGFWLFDEHLAVHTDVDLTKRVEHLGMRAVMCANVRVNHCRNTTFWKFLQRNFMMARTSRVLGIHRLPHTVLAAAGSGVLLLAVGSPWSEFLRLALGVCLTAYAALVLWCALKGFFRTRRPSVMALIPFLLGGVHLARALGYTLPVGRNK
jgi:glycosyltransferase involved in cell wall biosynthesis